MGRCMMQTKPVPTMMYMVGGAWRWLVIDMPQRDGGLIDLYAEEGCLICLALM